MAYNREYPYVDPNKYNDDWLLHEMERLRQEWEATKAEWETMKQQWQQMQNGWQQMQTAWANMQQAWQTYQTNLNNAWAQYKANMDADFAEYTTDMDQKWDDYKAGLNSEWETYKNNTNAYIQSLIPGSVNNWLDANFEGYWQDYVDTIQVPARIQEYIDAYWLKNKTVCFIADNSLNPTSNFAQVLTSYITQAGGNVINNCSASTDSTYWASNPLPVADFYIIILGESDFNNVTPYLTFYSNIDTILNNIVTAEKKAVVYIGRHDLREGAGNKYYYIYYSLLYKQAENRAAILVNKNVLNRYSARNVLSHMYYQITDGWITSNLILFNGTTSNNDILRIMIKPNLEMIVYTIMRSAAAQGSVSGTLYNIGILNPLYDIQNPTSENQTPIGTNVAIGTSLENSWHYHNVYLDDGNIKYIGYNQSALLGSGPLLSVLFYPNI